jgi:hypothetical protein
MIIEWRVIYQAPSAIITVRVRVRVRPLKFLEMDKLIAMSGTLLSRMPSSVRSSEFSEGRSRDRSSSVVSEVSGNFSHPANTSTLKPTP